MFVSHSKTCGRQWLRREFLAMPALGLAACARSPRLVIYVNSYHQGYGSSDAVAEGIRETLSGKPVTLETIYLDGKRRPEGLPEAASRALARIREAEPAVILVSDDDAMIHLVAPHLRMGPTPVLFCGVNWTASPYEVPNLYVSGMIEVLPVEETLRMVLGAKPECKELFILSEDSASERKSRAFLDPIYWRNGLSTPMAWYPTLTTGRRPSGGRMNILTSSSSSPTAPFASGTRKPRSSTSENVCAFPCLPVTNT